ncbi:hypothetical protein [Spirillospora sp. CA-128828]|uniref:hypothetical protein n=1 Tax=Spirillospora sp. CA-128828 TaxID=3240033 RepID=UPI003D8D5569
MMLGDGYVLHRDRKDGTGGRVAIFAIGPDARSLIEYSNVIFGSVRDGGSLDAQVAGTACATFASQQRPGIHRWSESLLPDSPGCGGRDELVRLQQYQVGFADSPFELLQAEALYNGCVGTSSSGSPISPRLLAHLSLGKLAANAAEVPGLPSPRPAARSQGFRPEHSTHTARGGPLRRNMIADHSRHYRARMGNLILYLASTPVTPLVGLPEVHPPPAVVRTERLAPRHR